MTRAQGWSIGLLASFLMWISILCIIFALVGCEESQLKSMDRIVEDANNITAAGGAAISSPAGALLPPDIRLYAAAAVALASIAVNSWQKVRANLMTKTTKAIVKGIEVSEREKKPNPTNPVKESIRTEMILAGIYDRGNQLVDQLKIAR